MLINSNQISNYSFMKPIFDNLKMSIIMRIPSMRWLRDLEIGLAPKLQISATATLKTRVLRRIHNGTLGSTEECLFFAL